MKKPLPGGAGKGFNKRSTGNDLKLSPKRQKNQIDGLEAARRMMAPINPTIRDRYGEPVEPDPQEEAVGRPEPRHVDAVRRRLFARPAIPPVSPAVQISASEYGDHFARELEAARYLSDNQLEARHDACQIIREGRRRRRSQR